MSESIWLKVLERHFGPPPGPVLTTWQGVSVLTEAGYTTAGCSFCRETFAGDADPRLVAKAVAAHVCELVEAPQ